MNNILKNILYRLGMLLLGYPLISIISAIIVAIIVALMVIIVIIIIIALPFYLIFSDLRSDTDKTTFFLSWKRTDKTNILSEGE